MENIETEKTKTFEERFEMLMQSFEKAEENGIGILKIVGDTVEYFTDNIKEY